MFPTHFIFNHFPKAGGTSFFAVCKHNFQDEEISPQLMEHEVRLVRPERFERYRLIRGHFSVLTQMGFSRNRYSVTLVRDPISTILSTYNFWRTRPEGDPITSEAKRMSFAEFVRRFADSPTIINNTYTHHFAAVSRDYPGEPEATELLLAIAKHNLAAFDFVGICEQFDETVALLCRETGWHLPAAMPHENRSVRVETTSSIDSGTMQILREHNQLDLQLYDFAKALFRTRSSRPTQGGSTEAAGDGSPQSRAKDLFLRNRFVPFPFPKASSRDAQILAVSAPTTVEGQDNKVCITYQTRNRIAELIAGVLIHDSDGNVMYGVNTMFQKVEMPHEPGREERVTLTLGRKLPPGTYSISAALARSDCPGFHYDWVDRATMLHILPVPSGESRTKQLPAKLAKKIFRPISQRIYERIDARLKLHLQPVEAKLGLLEATSASVRDRVAGLHEAVTALRAEQSELRRELLELSKRRSEMTM